MVQMNREVLRSVIQFICTLVLLSYGAVACDGVSSGPPNILLADLDGDGITEIILFHKEQIFVTGQKRTAASSC